MVTVAPIKTMSVLLTLLNVLSFGAKTLNAKRVPKTLKHARMFGPMSALISSQSSTSLQTVAINS